MQQPIEDGLLDWAVAAGFSLVSILVGLVLYKMLVFMVGRFTKPVSVPRIFFDAAAPALGALICLLAFNSTLHAIPQDLPLIGVLQQITTLFLFIALTWVAVGCTSAIGDVIVYLNPVLEGQWKRARKVETQTRFLVRCLNIVIILLGTGAALMTFDSVNQLGTSLLASAGVGGLILGFAARPVLSNLLAGMQIALTQPFRIDDVLFVQGEWCWVEEVTSTYVVLRIWDLRRLVVPLQWFIENPFQNWSRNKTELLGSATVWVDYGIPVEALREEFDRLLKATSLWDEDFGSVQVVEAGEKAMQVRFLMSAKDSNTLWDLRCYMREGLVAFVQQNFPECLPRFRAELRDDNSPPIEKTTAANDFFAKT